jgi:hypothetical protein
MEAARSGATLAVIVAIASLAAPASAQEPSADALVDEGIRLREERRDIEALERFERAYAIDAAPRTLAQIALAEQALGRFVDAEAHLREAIASGDTFVRRHRQLLEAALDEIGAQIVELRVDGGPAGATVRVADRDVGVLPLAEPVRVAVGTVVVEVRADGFEPHREEITVAAGDAPELTVELTARAEPPPSEPDPEPPTPSPAGMSTSDLLIIGGISAAGVGVVALAIASGLMVVREDHAQARVTCSDVDPACRDRFYAAVDAEAAGVAMYVVGGLFAAGGAALVTLVQLGILGERERAGEAWRCTPSLLGVTCDARF